MILFWAGYDLGFAAGVGFFAGILAFALAVVYVMYRASAGWSKW